MSIKPRYPIYVPSKSRYNTGLTIKFLIHDKVDFYIVVEPQEKDEYGKRYGYERLLVLPWSGADEIRKAYTDSLGIENGGLIAVRNWIRDHSIANGFARHWQLDDNIRSIMRRVYKKRIVCDSGIALASVEDFTDRYENIAISGLEYKMFAPGCNTKPPIYINHWVYSCSLINNSLPYRWRLAYNDDTDICLQSLAGGWCTVRVCVFLIDKIQTMLIRGGNTTDLYQGDGRLKMARSLERMWPGVVTIDRRFKRPQHVVDWSKFDTKLKLKPGVVIPDGPNEYGLELKQVKEIKSDTLRDWYGRVTGEKNLAE